MAKFNIKVVVEQEAATADAAEAIIKARTILPLVIEKSPLNPMPTGFSNSVISPAKPAVYPAFAFDVTVEVEGTSIEDAARKAEKLLNPPRY